MTSPDPGQCLVFDSSPLNYFARAGCLEVLEQLVEGRRCVMTAAVADELRRGVGRHNRLHQLAFQSWLEEVNDDSLQFLTLFATFHHRLGGGSEHVKDIGEAATLAYAELHACTAIIDDRAGRTAGAERGISLSSTLGLICHGLRKGLIEETQACAVVDALRDAEAFLPCDGDTFLGWARAEGLLEPS
jgi:predicted nucleic acid-binding protein